MTTAQAVASHNAITIQDAVTDFDMIMASQEMNLSYVTHGYTPRLIC